MFSIPKLNMWSGLIQARWICGLNFKPAGSLIMDSDMTELDQEP